MVMCLLEDLNWLELARVVWIHYYYRGTLSAFSSVFATGFTTFAKYGYFLSILLQTRHVFVGGSFEDR